MEHFCLRWNNFHRNMSSGFRTLLLEDTLVDVTLAADGHFVQAHRLVLSVCSPYFKELFSVNPCNHPIVILKDVKHKQLTDLLSFIYQGEVSVHQEDLAEFLKTAELLQIRGLADQNFGKDSAPTNRGEATTSEHSVPFKSTEAVSIGRTLRVQTDKNAGTSVAGHADERARERPPCVIATTSAAVLPPLPNSGTGQSSNVSCLPSELPTSVLLGIPIKQEPPDETLDFPQNTDVLESEHIQDREAQIVHEDITNARVVLEDMNHEELRETDNRAITESATSEGSNRPKKTLIYETKAMKNNALLGKMHRRQRKVALNKIRHFLVAPKRSRRIAFARKMKQRKAIIKKSAMNSVVEDVSTLLPAVGTQFPGVNSSNNSDILKKRILESENKSELVLSLSNTISKDTTVVDYQDTIVTLNQKIVKKVRKHWKGSRKRKKVVSSNNENFKVQEKLKNGPVNVVGEASDLSQELKIADPHFETNSNEDNEKSPISVDKMTALNNSKKMSVQIVAKNTKSAVALARKTKSNMTSEDSVTSHPLPTKTDLPASKSVRSGKSSNNDVEERPATGLRSNIPNGSLKDLTIANGATCRNIGCVGCGDHD